MFEKYNQFATSLSAPAQCSHCGQPAEHHNYYPHFAAIAALSSIVTILAFAVPMLLWAQTTSTPTTTPQFNLDQAAIAREVARREAKQFPNLTAAQIKNLTQTLKLKSLVVQQRLNQLKKEGTAVPSSTSEILGQIKQFLTENNTAQKLSKLATSSITHLQILNQKFTEEQTKTNLLNRWRTTQLQIDKEIANLNKILNQAKTLSKSLNEQGADTSHQLQELQEAINKLKTIRQSAIPITLPGSSTSSP